MSKPGLPHERLLAHRLAQRLACSARRLSAQLPRGAADLRDQLNRSSHSVVRHIAEGASRWSPADKLARFTIGQGELGECDATLETIERLGLADLEQVRDARALAQRVGALLNGLVRSQQARRSRGP